LGDGVGGSNQPLAVRVMHLCNELEIHFRLGGKDGAVAMARQRSGTALDPDLVFTFCSDPGGVLNVVGRTSLWDDLLSAESGEAPEAYPCTGLPRAGATTLSLVNGQGGLS
jgi:hypothetical protein